MDNNDALLVIRNYNVGTPGAVYDRTSQIDILVHDGHTMAYVFPPRNHIARFLARLAMNTCDYLYTMDHPIGRVEELLDYDMRMGIDYPNFMDIVLHNVAPDPVNFNIDVGFVV